MLIPIKKVVIGIPLYTYDEEGFEVRALTKEEEEGAIEDIVSVDNIRGWAINSVQDVSTKLVVQDGYPVGYINEPQYNKEQILSFIREYREESIHQGLELEFESPNGIPQETQTKLFQYILEDLEQFMDTVLEGEK